MRELIISKIQAYEDAYKIGRYVSIPKVLENLTDEELVNLFARVVKYS